MDSDVLSSPYLYLPETHTFRLSPPHVLLLDGDIREDNLGTLQIQLLGNVYICLTELKKLENLSNFVGKFMPFNAPQEISIST